MFIGEPSGSNRSWGNTLLDFVTLWSMFLDAVCKNFILYLLVRLYCVHRCGAEVSSLNAVHRNLSCSGTLLKSLRRHSEPKNWPLYNDVVYPPSLPDEPLRPAVSQLSANSMALLYSRT